MQEIIGQWDMFQGKDKFKITKPIRLMTLFSGYDSQSLSLKYLNAQFEHYRTCEWAVKSIIALKDMHFASDTNDYSKDLSKDEVLEYLFNKHISMDYSKPMTKDQIKRLGEEKQREIYNSIIASHNLVDVSQAKGEDFGIVDTDKYCYVLTYSYPCQDLSLAGKQKGMEKDSGTRSALLWEVDRILDELNNKGKDHLPQVLLMENVPQAIGQGNMKEFSKWLHRLEDLGYTNCYRILNATEYGVPQNRERCFMVSILGSWHYDFPMPKKLNKRLYDILEKDVDQKYYLTEEQLQRISNWKAQQDPLKDIDKEKLICPCLTARGAGEEHSGMILINESVYDKNYKPKPRLVGGLGEMKSHNGTQFFQQDRIYDSEEVAMCLQASFPGGSYLYKVEDKIRKLTPRECFRLMGVKDEDFDKISHNQNDTSLWHLAGDSIVVDVLMEIFKQML